METIISKEQILILIKKKLTLTMNFCTEDIWTQAIYYLLTNTTINIILYRWDLDKSRFYLSSKFHYR